MSLKTNFLLNNINISEPINYQELSLELNFDNDESSESVSVTEWDFGVGIQDDSDGSYAANKHISNGLSGGVGVGEGMPFELDLEYNGAVDNLFSGYIDLWDATIDCNLVTATATEKGGLDWLRGAANGVTFEYLYEEHKGSGRITDSDFVSVPYVINSIPNGKEAFLLTLTAFTITTTIISEINKMKDLIIESGFPTETSAVIKFAFQVIYVSTLIVSVVNLIIQAVKMLIQPIKYHKGMYLRDLAQRGAEYFGLEFKSTILESTSFYKAVILPQKNTQDIDAKDGVTGFFKPEDAQYGYFSGTYGGFLQMLKTMFNAKLMMSNGVIRLERKDYTTSTPKYILPNVEKGSYTLNKSDFVSNLFIEFQTDLNDKNTIQQYEGTTAQIQTTYKNAINKDMVLLSGFERKSIPLALGKRKVELNVPEKIIKAFSIVLDPLIGGLITLANGFIITVNVIIKAISKVLKLLKKIGIKIGFDPEPIKTIKYTPIKELIDNRINMLMMENDFINTPKIILVDEKSTPRNTKLNGSNESVLNSVYLYNNYYKINSFDTAENSGNANQYKIYESEVPFCYEDYVKVKSDNKLIDGEKEGEIISLRWNVDAQTAEIKYKINELYSNNFKTKIIDSRTGNPLV